MKAQHNYSTGKQVMQGVTLMVGLTLVALIGSLLVLMMSEAFPSRQYALDTAVVARPSTNRIFQDEINAARVLALGNAALPSSSRATVPHIRPASTNRLFLDEIAGAQTMNTEGLPAAFGELTPPHGPR